MEIQPSRNLSKNKVSQTIINLLKPVGSFLPAFLCYTQNKNTIKIMFLFRMIKNNIYIFVEQF